MKETGISVCIPTYEMHGKAEKLLIRGFDMLKKQTYKNFEVVISDNSKDDVVRNLCEGSQYKSLDIKYAKYPGKGTSKNTNNAMGMASGKLIKILHMDDYLANENSLQDISDNFKGNWLVTGCGHDMGNGRIINAHFPRYNQKIYLGKNTIGSPSVLTIKNENPLMFDEKLIWLTDCDYYERLYARYGEPDILNKVNVIIEVGEHQTTSNLKKEIKLSERIYMKEKYKNEKKQENKISQLWQDLLELFK